MFQLYLSLLRSKKFKRIFRVCVFILFSLYIVGACAPTSGQAGIRTLVALLPNGFQDRLVMTTSIPVHVTFTYKVKSKKQTAEEYRQVFIFYNKISLLSIKKVAIFQQKLLLFAGKYMLLLAFFTENIILVSLSN